MSDSEGERRELARCMVVNHEGLLSGQVQEGWRLFEEFMMREDLWNQQS